MPNLQPPVINCESVNPGFIVPNIEEAIAYYSQKLGFTLNFTWGDPKSFAAMTLGRISIHLITNEGKPGSGMAYFAVDEVDELYKFHEANGVEIVAPIENREYDMRDYFLRDIYGNQLGFGAYRMPATPALPIERTTLSVRLEKRLAALLAELADYKGMSISSTLEETLLHTFEPFGDGVASPHTKGQLRHIQELKQKHGIDYDVHASYRFVE